MSWSKPPAWFRVTLNPTVLLLPAVKLNGDVVLTHDEFPATTTETQAPTANKNAAILAP